MQEKIKVLMISVRADHGGGPKHIHSLIERLPDNFEIFVAAPDEAPYNKRFIETGKVKEYLFLPHRKFTIKSLIALINFIKLNKIDIIHSHGKGAGIYSRLAAAVTLKKCVHTFHGVHTAEYTALKKFVYLLIEKFLSVFTDKFISVSAGEERKLKENGLLLGSKLTVIENGVEIPTDFINSHKTSIPFNLFTVTRFDFAKNSEFMIEIASELNKLTDCNKIKFVVAGDGPDKKQIEEKLAQSGLDKFFDFIGFKQNISDWYLQTDCYLSTSRWEGLPLSVLEAGSFGLPSVVTDVVGNNDVIIDNINGILYREGNAKECANYIYKVATNTKFYDYLSQNARSIVVKKFSIEIQVEKTVKLYNDLLRKKFV